MINSEIYNHHKKFSFSHTSCIFIIKPFGKNFSGIKKQASESTGNLRIQLLFYSNIYRNKAALMVDWAFAAITPARRIRITVRTMVSVFFMCERFMGNFFLFLLQE